VLDDGNALKRTGDRSRRVAKRGSGARIGAKQVRTRRRLPQLPVECQCSRDEFQGRRGPAQEEFGCDYLLRREDQQRITQRLVRRLDRPGRNVMLEPATLKAR
jgi:hypothetical protein